VASGGKETMSAVGPTNPSQFESSERGELPKASRIREGVWVIPMELAVPSPPYSLCYVVADNAGAIHLIDPGYDLDHNWRRLQVELGALDFSIEDVASVTATHFHPDHLGMATRVRNASGGQLVMFGLEYTALDELVRGEPQVPDYAEWGVPVDRREALASLSANRSFPSVAPDVLMAAHGQLPVPGRSIEIVPTPGHTSGHMALRDSDEGLFFTGDHLLPKIFPGIGLGGPSADPLGEYLRSLTRIEEYGDDEVCPGHGYQFRGLRERVEETRAHQNRRTNEVERIIGASPTASVWEVASQVSWTVGWANLLPNHLSSALRQTAMRLDYLGQ
jgi:glyoxylase-like metal-dependent hydrolase (beta-lactamase superfamily II)